MTCCTHLFESQVPHFRGHLRTRGPPPREAQPPQRDRKQSKGIQLASERGTEESQTATKSPSQVHFLLSLRRSLQHLRLLIGVTRPAPMRLLCGSPLGLPGPRHRPPSAPTDTHSAFQPFNHPNRTPCRVLTQPGLPSGSLLRAWAAVKASPSGPASALRRPSQRSPQAFLLPPDAGPSCSGVGLLCLMSSESTGCCWFNQVAVYSHWQPWLPESRAMAAEGSMTESHTGAGSSRLAWKWDMTA